MISRPAIAVYLDPRLLDAVVQMTGEVAAVADTLVNLGMGDEADRLLTALDRMDDTEPTYDHHSNGDAPDEDGEVVFEVEVDDDEEGWH